VYYPIPRKMNPILHFQDASKSHLGRGVITDDKWEGGGWGGGGRGRDREVKRRSYICLSYPSARSPQRPSVLYHVNATRARHFFCPLSQFSTLAPPKTPHKHHPPPRPLNSDPFFFKYSRILPEKKCCVCISGSCTKKGGGKS